MCNDALVDATGNFYIVGSTESTDLPRAKSRTDFGRWKAWIAKVDASGAVLWTNYVVNRDNSTAEGVAVDRDGNAFLVGHSNDGELPQRINEGKGAFVTKFSPTGDILWTVYLTNGGAHVNYAMGVATDPSGAVYVSGEVTGEGSLMLGEKAHRYAQLRAVNAASEAEARLVLGQPYGGQGDAFVTKVTPAGSIVWSRHIGGNQDDRGRGVTVDKGGNVFVVGKIFWEYGPKEGDDCQFVKARNQWHGQGTSEGFLTKLDTAGTVEWSCYIGGSGGDGCADVITDAAGQIFVSGHTESPDIEPRPTNFQESGEDDGFFLKADDTGNIRWITLAGGPPGTGGGRMVWGPAGHLLGLAEGEALAAVAIDPQSGQKLWYGYVPDVPTRDEVGIGLDDSGRLLFIGNAGEHELPGL
jgi:hypothetical protein